MSTQSSKIDQENSTEKITAVQKERKIKKQNETCSSTDELSVHDESVEDGGDTFDTFMEGCDRSSDRDIQQNLKEEEFVVVEYDGRKYPGVVMKLLSGDEDGLTVD
ncbi:hypothetical protein QE152_g33697 [Popillia japonica]|uniref:Uncharacterized protein n=1 Tax=Popillia japonica TaxID=7064 RepID=A0AAW1IVS2_POPJA